MRPKTPVEGTSETREIPIVKQPGRMSDAQFKVIAQAVIGSGAPEEMALEAHRARESEKAALAMLDHCLSALKRTELGTAVAQFLEKARRS